ncbi:MAG: hypothetical protein EA249_01035 [Alkalibacterium sp.]|nr:MAG: hypothetical protein EA249_01035 [Alkalibacterium sp.]
MKGIFNVAETVSMPYEAEAQRQRCMKMKLFHVLYTLKIACFFICIKYMTVKIDNFLEVRRVG